MSVGTTLWMVWSFAPRSSRRARSGPRVWMKNGRASSCVPVNSTRHETRDDQLSTAGKPPSVGHWSAGAEQSEVVTGHGVKRQPRRSQRPGGDDQRYSRNPLPHATLPGHVKRPSPWYEGEPKGGDDNNRT